MSTEQDIKVYHTSSSDAAWLAVAVIVSVLGLAGFYVMQTSGFSGDTQTVSVTPTSPVTVPLNQ